MCGTYAAINERAAHSAPNSHPAQNALFLFAHLLFVGLLLVVVAEEMAEPVHDEIVQFAVVAVAVFLRLLACPVLADGD